MFILEPKAGGSAYKKAAQVFAELYEAVTGVTLPIKDTPSDTEDMVVIGTDGVQPFGFAKLEGGFPVRMDTDDYCIISKEETGRTLLFLAGGRGRSTLYAVYNFFERRADCHYFWDGDVIPKTESIDISGLHVVESPRFEYRAIRYFAHRGLMRFQAEHWDFDQWKQEIDWLVKARLNLFMLRIGMDDLFQKAFPDIVPYPPEEGRLPGTGDGYDNRTTSWSLQYRGELRKKVLSYAFECDLMHPEDFGTMTHWYSRTPVEFLEKVKPTLLAQTTVGYSEQTGLVWDIFDDKNVENYLKLTDTHVKEYGQGQIFHTIGLAERDFSDDRKKNLELKKFAYKRFMSHINEKYPNAKTLIAGWDFYFRLKADEVREMVKIFDPEKTLLLDYSSDLKREENDFEVWDIMGKLPWIFGIFHGYAPNSHTHGDYDFIAKKLAVAAADPYCKGMDFWPELSHSDTLMLAYFTENAWRPTGRTIGEIADDLSQKRYLVHKEPMKKVWQAFVPLLKLSTGAKRDEDIEIPYHLLSVNRDHLKLANPETPNRDELINHTEARLHTEKNFEAGIKALIKTLRDLPQAVTEDPFALRDCVDLFRTVVLTWLHYGYLEAGLLFARWQKGETEASAVLEKWDFSRKLLDLYGDILRIHVDNSIYETLQELGANRKVNPAFEEALKDNALCGYCRSAAYEAVRYVYSKEADVLQNWISKCIAAGKAEAVPAEEFLDAGKQIFAEFKAIPLADMQAEPYHSLQETAGRVYDFLT